MKSTSSKKKAVPQAVPFDNADGTPGNHGKEFPETFKVTFALREPSKTYWKPKVEELWRGKTKESHSQVEAAFRAHHAAAGNEVNLTGITYC